MRYEIGNMFIIGGDIIKKGLYIMSIVILTLITTSLMLYFHPDKDTLLPEQVTNFISGFANKSYEKQAEKTKDIIDDNILGKFTKFYADRDIKTLEIYEKEEIRSILESMGLYNTSKLISLLKDGYYREDDIYELLHENLFEEQIMILDEILK